MRLLLLLALVLPQTVPSGGAIAKYVPPAPTPASFISDQRTVLSPAAHAALDARIGAIQRAGLGDIAVAILPSIGDYSANQVAVEIYRTWRVGSVDSIGSARRNVGLLLLIVPKELAPNGRGECWIDTGTGAEGIITDASAGSICRDSIIPHLRERDYAAAVGAGIGALESKLRGDAGLSAAGGSRGIASPRSRRSPLPTSSAQSAPCSPSSLRRSSASAAWRRYHRRRCPRCGRTMRRLDEAADDARLVPGQVVEERLGSVDYDVWACECGESWCCPIAPGSRSTPTAAAVTDAPRRTSAPCSPPRRQRRPGWRRTASSARRAASGGRRPSRCR